MFFSVFLLLLFNIEARSSDKCTIIGEVYGRTSEAVYLFKASENITKFPEKMHLLNIINGKFEVVIETNQIEPYVIVFKEELDKGAYKKIVFFPNREVLLKLYSFEEFESKTTAIGGPLNECYYKLVKQEYRLYSDEAYLKLLDAKNTLIKGNRYFSQEMSILFEKLKTATSDRFVVLAEQKMLIDKGSDLTELGRANKLLIDSSLTKNYSLKYDKIETDINLATYFLLISDLQKAAQLPFLKMLISSISDKFINTYPLHPYSTQLKLFLNSQDLVKEKGKFIDFEIENKKNIAVRVSSLFSDNKFILLNFWGSWCGPCLAKMDMVYPLYKKYKTKGFDVISIAREFKTLSAWKNRIKANGYNWQNFVDFNDKYDVWNTYGILNATGRMILLNQNGVILLSDPSPKELETFVKNQLNP